LQNNSSNLFEIDLVFNIITFTVASLFLLT